MEKNERSAAPKPRRNPRELQLFARFRPTSEAECAADFAFLEFHSELFHFQLRRSSLELQEARELSGLVMEIVASYYAGGTTAQETAEKFKAAVPNPRIRSYFKE